MKNKEMYLNEMINAIVNDECCKFKEKCIHQCDYLCCEECNDIFREWLEAEYVEREHLSDDEITILKNIDKEYNYIVRNSFGNLVVYKDIATKDKDMWYGDTWCDMSIYNHLFKFITWKDKSTGNIDILLRNHGVSRYEK